MINQGTIYEQRDEKYGNPPKLWVFTSHWHYMGIFPDYIEKDNCSKDCLYLKEENQ
jgi:hypothetical protein